MWISKKKWNEMEKKIADLESNVQSQRKAFCFHLEKHEEESSDLKEIFKDIKNELIKECSKCRKMNDRKK